MTEYTDPFMEKGRLYAHSPCCNYKTRIGYSVFSSTNSSVLMTCPVCYHAYRLNPPPEDMLAAGLVHES